MLDWKRCRSYLAAAALAASLGACGGSSGPTSPPTTTMPPVPCTQTVVESGSENPAKARTLYYFDFSVPDSGRLDVTMDWTNAASLIGLYLVPANTCTLAEFNARTCNFLIRSETSVKPRKVSVPNFNAGNYRWLIGNFSDNDEAISYQFVLSKGPCPALTVGAPPSVSARGGDAFPALTRAEAH